MDRYEDRTPLWDYSDNSNYDDRSSSDYRWSRARAEEASRAYVAADEADGDRPNRHPDGGRYRDRYSQGGDPRADRPRYAQDRRYTGRTDERGYSEWPSYDRGRGNDRAAQERSGWGWPGEFGYPPLSGYSPYGFDPRARRDYDPGERGFFERAGDEVMSWFGDRDARRRRELDHSGRGPKNYVRSDERIREDVNDRLTADVWLDASEINVVVADGEVTLSGTVEDRSAKRRAEDDADSIAGVRHVQNNLRYHAGVESPDIK